MSLQQWLSRKWGELHRYNEAWFLLRLCWDVEVGISSTMIDIDECNLGELKCSLNANCTNTLGSFQCSCKAGLVILCSSKFITISCLVLLALVQWLQQLKLTLLLSLGITVTDNSITIGASLSAVALVVLIVLLILFIVLFVTRKQMKSNRLRY